MPFLNISGNYTTEDEEVLDAEQLAERLPNLPNEGVCNINVEKQVADSYEAILITEDVLRGLQKQDPNRNSLKKNLWTKADGDFRGVTKAVYQASLIWIV